MRRFCQWAGCRNPATAHEDGWDHCRPHLYEHRRQLAEPKKPGPAKGQRGPCGTRSGYQAHYRHSETPCDPCREAERQYQHDRHLRRRSA